MTPADTLTALARMAGRLPEGRGPLAVPTLKRDHLPILCRVLGFTEGAEIGVWKGAYSALCCETAPSLHMRCVDPWTPYPEWKDGKHLSDPEKAERQMLEALEEATAALAGKRATILRGFSVDVAATVPDGSLDFVYLDGNHGYAAVSADLAAWVPKVRSGGIVAGHDFKYFFKKPYIEVVRAVTDYARKHGIERWYTTAADRTPSFLWVQA
jgi:hypothetical protein